MSTLRNQEGKENTKFKVCRRKATVDSRVEVNETEK